MSGGTQGKYDWCHPSCRHELNANVPPGEKGSQMIENRNVFKTALQGFAEIRKLIHFVTIGSINEQAGTYSIW